MKIIGIIPARFASTRFPGKPLHLIAGKPLVQRVVEQAQKASSLDDVIVAQKEELRAGGQHCSRTNVRGQEPYCSCRLGAIRTLP